jgi:rod shape-determining protein MreD
VRVALAIVVPLVAALLQGSVAPFIVIGGARPNLVVLVAACWSAAAGAREGVWWAFVGGLAADLLSGGPVGAQALAALLPVAAVGLSDTSLRARSALTGAALVGAATLAAGLSYLAILAVVGAVTGDIPPLLAAVGGSAIYNGVLAIATFPLLQGLRRTTEKQASFGL